MLLCWSLRGRRLHGVRVAPREGDTCLDLCPCIDKSPSCSFIPVQAVLPPHRPARRCTHDLPCSDSRHRCVVTPARRGSAIRLLSSYHALGLDQEPLHPPEVHRAGGRNCQNSSRGGRLLRLCCPYGIVGAHGAGVTAVVVLSGTMGAGEHRTLLRTRTVSPKRRTATTRSQQALMSRGWHCWAGVGAARPARGEVVSASAPVGQRAETIKKGN